MKLNHKAVLLGAALASWSDEDFEAVYKTKKGVVRVQSELLEVLAEKVERDRERNHGFVPVIERQLAWLEEVAGRMPDIRRG